MRSAALSRRPVYHNGLCWLVRPAQYFGTGINAGGGSHEVSGAYLELLMGLLYLRNRVPKATIAAVNTRRIYEEVRVYVKGNQLHTSTCKPVASAPIGWG